MHVTDPQRRVLLDYLSSDDRSHTIRATYGEWLAAVPELAAFGLLAVVEGTLSHEITDAGRAAAVGGHG
jgi:hypothetical protein